MEQSLFTKTAEGESSQQVQSPLWLSHVGSVMEKARLIMERDNVDAIVASTAENFYYLAGFPSFFIYTRRVAGTALAVIFRDPNRKPVMIMNEFEAASVPDEARGLDIRTFPIWIDIDDPLSLKGSRYTKERPQTFQINDVFKMLGEVLSEAGVTSGKVALELSTMQHPSWLACREALPQIEAVEALGYFIQMKSVKTLWEISLLRKAAALAEKGIREAVSTVRMGCTAAELGAVYKSTIARDPDCMSTRLAMITVGNDFSPRRTLPTDRARPGDLIKFDVGAEIDGYGSDLARTFVLGEPSDLLKRIYSALRTGHDKLLSMVGPGVPMSSMFHEAMKAVHEAGLPSYNRGHLGHSTGLVIEEMPFVGPNEQRVFEPGMVYCLETPYYGYGVGAIMIEDMVLITENGYENLNTMSRDLISLPL